MHIGSAGCNVSLQGRVMQGDDKGEDRQQVSPACMLLGTQGTHAVQILGRLHHHRI